MGGGVSGGVGLGWYISVFLGRDFGLFTFGADSAYRLKSFRRVFDTKRTDNFEIKKEIVLTF